ncbi:nitrilotriacetate monooxygenase [Mycolicibacterium litorale]|uniref:Nitrilotriacetate monooxygenase n=1 Tax=Mycolicibacterium litorale TaxID=758802 RepID=A0A6S6P7Q3_9MYCO|nr:flavin reductase family protein [Mycolicibacterium litorale]BCI53477.1 nitrilotriacetate monooxygenase [Mycolicibacterium litorale]
MNTTIPLVAPRDFIRAITRTATPVTIVTAQADGVRLGQTVSAFNRISDEPAILGVCINRRSPIHGVIRSCGAFNVSVLAREHSGVADSFAGRGGADRPPFTFLDREWRAGDNGLPVFADGLATFECTVHSVTEIGSHLLYLGEVSRAVHRDAEPLLHQRGTYRTLAEQHTEGHHA